jgi:hypothetical protein
MNNDTRQSSRTKGLTSQVYSPLQGLTALQHQQHPSTKLTAWLMGPQSLNVLQADCESNWEPEKRSLPLSHSIDTLIIIATMRDGDNGLI